MAVDPAPAGATKPSRSASPSTAEECANHTANCAADGTPSPATHPSAGKSAQESAPRDPSAPESTLSSGQASAPGRVSVGDNVMEPSHNHPRHNRQTLSDQVKGPPRPAPNPKTLGRSRRPPPTLVWALIDPL